MESDSAPFQSFWIETPSFGIVRGGIARGFRWLSVALGVYGGSAGLAGLSVGLWLLAIDAGNRGEPASRALNIVASAATEMAALFALVALVILFVGSSHLRPSSQVALRTTVPVLQWYRNVLASAIALGTITALLMAGLTISRGRAPILGSAMLALSGATATAFLGAVIVPLYVLGPPERKALLWFVSALSVTAIVAEVVVALPSMSGISRSINWLTFGGYPLLNWHLVFGAIVAGCSLFLARRYWALATDLAGHRARPLPNLP